MHLNFAQIDQSSVIWILVADGDLAQVYRYHKNKAVIPMHESKRNPYDKMIKSHDLTPILGMAFQAESLSEYEIKRDERGSLIAQQYSGQSTHQPYDDMCEEIAQNLVTKVASKLNHYCKTKAFDKLVIAAPAKIMVAIKRQLNPDTLSCVVAEIDKDFTNDKSHALLAHLQDIFEEARIG